MVAFTTNGIKVQGTKYSKAGWGAENISAAIAANISPVQLINTLYSYYDNNLPKAYPNMVTWK